MQELRIPRYALVVGVQDYRELKKVQNAVNDAQVIGRALSQVDFKHARVVHDIENQYDLLTEISELVSMIGGSNQAATIVFYFAGHGFQYGGKNYLALRSAGKPIRDPQTDETDKSQLIAGSIQVEQIIEALGGTRRAGATVVFIDACRTNILEADSTPGRPAPKGFARYTNTSTQNAFISFAAQYDQAANSQSTQFPYNSPYASALGKFITREGMLLNPGLLVEVKGEVQHHTRHLDPIQTPESVNPEGLGTYFYFKRHATAHIDEQQLWRKAFTSNDITCVRSFLDKYRDGYFSQQAANYLESERSAIEGRDRCDLY